MPPSAFQDAYPDDYSHCYGCGRLNPHGLQIKTVWDGDDAVTVFTPQPYHTAVAGYVYGGLIASLIDCHGTGTASAAAYRAEGRAMGTEPDRIMLQRRTRYLLDCSLLHSSPTWRDRNGSRFLSAERAGQAEDAGG